MKKTLLLFCLLQACFAQAVIRHVPADYATIQQAVLASGNGDTVLVAPGTYFENINFRGRKIVLTSNYYLAKDSAFICSTLINGSQPLHADSASCITLNHNEDSTTVIQGFTISGGLGSKWLDTHGAGTFREGGGILTEFSSPVIRWNRIINNHITSATGVAGTGGGGMRCGDGHPLIYGNLVAYNSGGYGGGIVLNYCNNARVKNNVIAHNSGGQNYGGGGVWATGTNTTTTVYIENNTIACNHVSGVVNYGGKGGGLFVFSITMATQNNIIFNNTQSSGNAIAAFANGSITATYSDIDFAYAGTGNINSDPQFMDTLFFVLNNASPCVDAGNPAAAVNDLTLSANSALAPSKGNARNDMGAYGGPMVTLMPQCPALVTAIHENQAAENTLIYPNPVNGKLFIRTALLENKEASIELFNLQGQKILELNSLHYKIEEGINLSAIPAGAYFLIIKSSSGNSVKKIMLSSQ